ncbi:SPASM domain-containing protein [bacterium]|nr:SPASM domain-containing protein [bacterium]
MTGFRDEYLLSYKEACKIPFTHCEIYPDGELWSCCEPFFKDISFGNIFEKPFNEIWNGKTFNEFRNKMLNGDFSNCHRDLCMYSPINNIDTIKNCQYPEEILLCYDQECNYKCITCRDEILTYSDEELKKLEHISTKNILPIIKHVDKIIFSGGDPLASRHARTLIKTVTKINPNIKINLQTQGYYLDKANMEKLGIKKLDNVSISIHAATRNTYNKIMRKDAFNKIMKNLKFISEGKKQGKIGWIVLNFVVHSMNYKEMPAFVKIAEKYDATAHFWSYKPWPSAEMHKRYNEVAVFEPFHKDYPKLQKILHNPIFKSPHCILYPELLKIAMS